MEKLWDIVIVGAGTAGLSAAIYGARAGKKVLVLDGAGYGGQIVKTLEIENYPGLPKVSGYDFATALYEQTLALGAEIVFEKVIDAQDKKNVKTVRTQNGQYEGKTLILATGAKNRPLGLAKEEALTGAGVSYCATCDGAFYKGREVAVVGGGSTALGDALFLSSCCDRVCLVHRRDAFRGEGRLLESLKAKSNVEFILNSNVTELKGEERLEGIVVEERNSRKKRELAVSGLFVAVGQMPQNEVFANLVRLDAQGYIVADETCGTGTPGVFTAGDCRTKNVRQLATAASDGAIAGLAACGYIDEGAGLLA